jgi:short-subunit dehydrogenase
MSEDTVLILGARSDIAMAVARRFAKEGYSIQLAARNVENLSVDKSDIELRYDVTVSLHEFDVLNIEAHNGFVNSLIQLPSVAICAIGYMGKQSENEKDILEAARVMRSNYEGPVSILALLANQFEQRGSGTLVGISSVAGERGRATNYVYGSAKAGYTAFLSGLRNRLAQKGVHVITALPGFVDTKMTEGMDLPARLTANPDELANKIFEAIRSRKNIFYYKKIWFLIMIIIRNIPESLFKNMKI